VSESAFWFRRQVIAYEVLGENQRQNAKSGVERDQHLHTWMTILGKEYGEACQAALQITCTDVEKGNDYREELV